MQFGYLIQGKQFKLCTKCKMVISIQISKLLLVWFVFSITLISDSCAFQYLTQ